MTRTLKDSLQHFGLTQFKPEWGQIRRGIEKESLRVTSRGTLAQTDHPRALGSALTHTSITTDYSEALLELITPVSDSIEDCLQQLHDLHAYTCANLPEGERLWVSSMPCLIESDEQIPLARYGSSNVGKLKTLYREGLGLRYGRVMQTIAGIHYNFSMPENFWPEYRALKGATEPLQEFQTRQYLHLIRNFHRYSWLLPYLFGASPAVSRCFTRGRPHDLEAFDESTWYKPWATALRMGNLGYKSEAQKTLFVCYNELGSYLDSLQKALTTPYAPYVAIGARKDGHLQQINTNLLQLENEFYGTIRPKRVGDSSDRPLTLLRNQGIQYIEVRVLDLNPFLPVGIDAEQIRFLDAFLLHCLLSDSPACTRVSYNEIEENLSRIVNRGREPGLTLSRGGQEVAFAAWADELLQDVGHAAVLLDNIHNTADYSLANAAQLAKLANPDLTPSARVLREMREARRPFCAYTMGQSAATQAHFTGMALPEKRLQEMQEASRLSLVRQAEIEAGDTVSFEDYVRQWNLTAESHKT
jgi:glutamate--cysteine ligase